MPTLDQIARDFQHGRFTFDDIAGPLLWVALGAGVLAGIGLAWDHWRLRKEQHKKTTAIQDKDRIRAILNDAVLTRSRMDVRFSVGEMRTSMACSLTEVSAESLFLEIPFGIHPTPSWQGREIVAYFHITPKNAAAVFYSFHSPIVNVYPSETDISRIEVALPTALDLSQRRRHFRLELPSADLLDLRLWLPDPSVLPSEPDPAAWPEPLLTFPHIGVVDISAGGIRLSLDPLRLPRPTPDGQRVSLESIRLYVGIRSLPKEPQGYFFEARLRNQFKDYATSRLFLGYQFERSAIRQGTTPLSWRSVSPEYGVNELGNWIFRRHMELYRQHAALATP